MTIDLQFEKIFDNWPESWKKHLTIDLQVEKNHLSIDLQSKKIIWQLTCSKNNNKKLPWQLTCIKNNGKKLPWQLTCI